MKKIISPVTFLLITIALNTRAATSWRTIDAGLEYFAIDFTSSSEQEAKINLFKIDPEKFDLKILRAKDEKKGETARNLAIANGALLAINGGFYDTEHKSIGLLIQNGVLINRMHRTSWWSIFSIKGNTASISVPKEFVPSNDIRMAIQVGPRLVVNGTIPRLKESSASYRSAIGITDDEKILIAASDAFLSLTEIAKWLSKFCPNAMALDGGSSTQLYINWKGFALSVGTNSLITNGIGIFPK